ncbi:FRG domain protein [Pirellula staleyi DSM 6068]|uniref:FRG domain protein n=1 Tax=Pirellula staleyi (strain ATCC 27377 / DSM 6068 / ICPB 4128) TaxID=530564 RepID=D2R681_PIRSD|nr:FRG domain-containing protein [Pirellula staleyi]ADB15459.1 FRG domain protein [Pirellula staleyi DSM 6068]
MIEHHITDIDDLIRQLNMLPNNFIFRGQSNAEWDLTSSLERAIGNNWSKDISKKCEDHSLIQFQSKFHLYDRINAQPNSKLAWLALMQHHGVPTRLVDFTESPYVALYFALESYLPHTKSDLAIFAIDYSAVMEKSLDLIRSIDSGFSETRATVHGKRDMVFQDIVDRFSYDILWITEPSQLNARLDRQAGSFVLSGNGGRKIDSIIRSDTYQGATIIKLIISHELYSDTFALLRKMNITSKSLYGDIDGLARSIRMEMQVYTAPI